MRVRGFAGLRVRGAGGIAGGFCRGACAVGFAGVRVRGLTVLGLASLG